MMENPFWFDAGGPLTVPLFFMRGFCLSQDYADLTDFYFWILGFVLGDSIVGLAAGGLLFFLGDDKRGLY